MSPCFGFPSEHQRLWLAAKLTTKLAVSAYWLAGARMCDVLVIVAAPSSIAARIVTRFYPSAAVDSDNETIVAVLSGDAANDLAQNLRGVPQYRRSLPVDSFALLVVDGHDHRVISKCDARRRIAGKHQSGVPAAGANDRAAR